MEYIYASMLLHAAKKEVNEESVKKVLQAAGVSADEGRVKALIAALQGVDIDAAIKEAAVAPVAAAPAAPVAPAAKAAPKEEKKSEEAAAAGLAGLFG